MARIECLGFVDCVRHAHRLATKSHQMVRPASIASDDSDNETIAEPVGGAQFTGFDRDGKGHQMVRPTSTASDDSDNETIVDPRERARLAKAEVCTPA